MNFGYLAAAVVVVLLVFAPIAPAFAYVGPGAGLGVIGSLIAVGAAALMAVGVIVWWPVRHMLRRAKKGSAAEEQLPEGETRENRDTPEGNSANQSK